MTYLNTGKLWTAGTVVDEQGQPVNGPAIRMGNDLVFTDNAGAVFLHVKNERPVCLAVVPSEFTTPGQWETVTAPEQATPGEAVQIVMGRGAS